jgi:hypothetical protein
MRVLRYSKATGFHEQRVVPFETLFTQNIDPGLELDAILAPVPKPPTILMPGVGLASLGMLLRKRCA